MITEYIDNNDDDNGGLLKIQLFNSFGDTENKNTLILINKNYVSELKFDTGYSKEISNDILLNTTILFNPIGVRSHECRYTINDSLIEWNAASIQNSLKYNNKRFITSDLQVFGNENIFDDLLDINLEIDPSSDVFIVYKNEDDVEYKFPLRDDEPSTTEVFTIYYHSATFIVENELNDLFQINFNINVFGLNQNYTSENRYNETFTIDMPLFDTNILSFSSKTNCTYITEEYPTNKYSKYTDNIYIQNNFFYNLTFNDNVELYIDNIDNIVFKLDDFNKNVNLKIDLDKIVYYKWYYNYITLDDLYNEKESSTINEIIISSFDSIGTLPLNAKTTLNLYNDSEGTSIFKTYYNIDDTPIDIQFNISNGVLTDNYNQNVKISFYNLNRSLLTNLNGERFTIDNEDLSLSLPPNKYTLTQIQNNSRGHSINNYIFNKAHSVIFYVYDKLDESSIDVKSNWNAQSGFGVLGDEIDLLRALEMHKNLSGVKFIDYDIYDIHPTSNAEYTKIDKLHRAGLTGRNTVVAIIDSGLYDFNEKNYVNYETEIKDNLEITLWKNTKEYNGDSNKDDDENNYVDDYFGWDFINNDNIPDDKHDHGTFCASQVAYKKKKKKKSNYLGCAPDCTIMVIRMLDKDGTGTSTQAMLNSVKYAISKNVDIISNSWGYSSTTYINTDLNRLFDLAYVKGIAVFFAAGNNYLPIPTSPANQAYSGKIMAVGAYDQLYNEASFSNSAGTIAQNYPYIGALGTLADGLNRKGNFIQMSGTSMACPLVAAAASCLCEYLENVSFAQPSDKVDLIFKILSGNAYQGINSIINTQAQSSTTESTLTAEPVILEPMNVRYCNITKRNNLLNLNIYDKSKMDIKDGVISLNADNQIPNTFVQITNNKWNVSEYPNLDKITKYNYINLNGQLHHYDYTSNYISVLDRSLDGICTLEHINYNVDITWYYSNVSQDHNDFIKLDSKEMTILNQKYKYVKANIIFIYDNYTCQMETPILEL